MSLSRILLGALVVLMLAGSVQAAVYEQETFDQGWTMGSEWTQDRSLPGIVESSIFDGEYRLRLGLTNANQDSWHNYQGIKHDVDMPELGRQSFSVELYLDVDWSFSPHNAGLWGQGKDADGENSAWPILVYRSGQDIEAGFYSYDYLDDGFYGWDLFKSVDASEYGKWYELKFELTQGLGVEYFINGESLGLFTDTDTMDLSAVILNAYNFGENEDIYFDNFTAEAEASAVPVPAAVWLLGSGLVGLLGVRRKFRQ